MAEHHPNETFTLQGHEAAEASFEDARERGRLHHAWLLTGPEGVGKATFAYRAARRLLGAPAEPNYGILGAAPDHPVSRQIIAHSHPDILVLERVGEDGKPRKVIPVDEARKLSEFFSKSPATAPHRVAIIDAADDLNVNAANAVLKTLEEPPSRGVLLLVSHSPGRLLPTIRSRCRRLAFHALPEDEVAA
ncbi:DNA polymerase III subunit delta', partial [Phenylobacterium sp.]|uniref:DNA polymerase III subunit delta' n=1 Tax=Phenylobacterium sp. TaxID=1871053 RepID=UPI00286CF1F6